MQLSALFPQKTKRPLSATAKRSRQNSYRNWGPGLLFLLMSSVLAGAASAQKVTLHLKDAPIQRVFKAIFRQTGYSVVFDEALFAEEKPVTLDFKQASIAAVLNSCLKDRPFTYQISNRMILIRKKQTRIEEDSSGKQTAPKIVPSAVGYLSLKGKVTDSLGSPLPGATVRLGTMHLGTHTSTSGEFELQAIHPGDELIISFVGFKEKRIVIGDNVRYYHIILRPLENLLDEMVIQGYGTTTRRFNLGSISSVTKEEIERQPVNNILQALENRIPGMQITPRGSIPGSAPDIKIRGTSSIAAGTAPLFILDGIPIPESQSTIGYQALDNANLSLLLDINPADIESIDVLKDADATAIYGSRGANGVVLITTKRGKQDGLHVQLNAYTGTQKVPHFVDMMDVHEYNQMRREAMANDGITPTAANAPDLFDWDTTRETNWQKMLIGKTSKTNDVNLSVSGGSENTHFYLSSAYHNEGTVMPGNADFSRRSFHGNLSHLSRDRRFSLNLSTTFEVGKLNLIQQDLTSFINIAPSYSLYKEDGTPNWEGARGFPLAYTMQPYASNTQTYNGQFNISYELIKGLQLKLNAGFNNSISDQSLKSPSYTLDPRYYSSGSLQLGNYNNYTWILEPQAAYTKAWGVHHLKALLGGTFQKSSSHIYNATGQDFASDALIGDIASAGTTTISDRTSTYAYASLFGRLTYDYREQYLANISFRRDGSSKFGPGKRFGNFGAMGLGWIFTQQPAVKASLPWLSFGKLRGSYGVSGNDQIDDYGYLSVYSSSSTGPLSYDGPSLLPSRLANPDYSWEETWKFDAALELGFIHNRLLLTVDYFQNRSSNQLVSYALSPQSGFSSYQANLPATIQNRGLEIELTSQNIDRPTFSWKTSLSLSKSKNVLLKFKDIENTSYYSMYEVGRSLGLRMAYVYQGLDDKGVPVLEDLNEDGTINSLDRKFIGDSDPFFGGMSNDIRIKDFSLSFFIAYTRVSNFNNIIPASRLGVMGSNNPAFFLDRWQKPGDEHGTDIPAFTTKSSTYNARFFSQSDIWWESNNIFRLSNVSLSYELPPAALSFLKISSAKVYINGQNLLVTDPHKSYRLDPLTGNTALPPLRTFVLGLNCSF